MNLSFITSNVNEHKNTIVKGFSDKTFTISAKECSHLVADVFLYGNKVVYEYTQPLIVIRPDIQSTIASTAGSPIRCGSCLIGIAKRPAREPVRSQNGSASTPWFPSVP